MRRHRRNPVVAGHHPDLFEDEPTPLFDDWRELSERSLIESAKKGDLTPDDLEEIRQEDKRLYEKLFEVAILGREQRFDPFLNELHDIAYDAVEDAFSGSGIERYQDDFQSDVYQNFGGDEVLDKASEIIPALAEYDLSGGEEADYWSNVADALRDPDLFDIFVDDFDYYDSPPRRVGLLYYTDVYDLAEYVPLDSMRAVSQDALEKAHSQADIDYIIRKAASFDPPIQLEESDLKTIVIDREDIELYMGIIVKKVISWVYNKTKLEAVWDEIKRGSQKEPSPETDNKVYEFKDGFYIAQLEPEDLRWEGAKLGICVGRKDMGYYEAVKNGRMAIFSLRTPSGKPKLTFEAKLWDVGTSTPYPFDKIISGRNFLDIFFRDGDEKALSDSAWIADNARQEGLSVDVIVEKAKAYRRAKQAGREDAAAVDRVSGFNQVKGKANRLPGFNRGEHGKLSKADEVEKAIEFVTSLGIHPQDIRDLQPGYEALDDWKAEQEAKRARQKAEKAAKKTRKNPPDIKVSKSLQRDADAAFEEPFGGVW